MKLTNYPVYSIVIWLLSAAPINITYAALVISPDVLSEIWYRDNKTRIAHKFMAMSDGQLAMQSPESNVNLPDLLIALDIGRDDVHYPTTEGMRTGRIDGLSINMVNYDVALFLESIQVSDNANQQSWPKDSWIDYVDVAAMATMHNDGWLLSVGILMRDAPLQQNNVFVNKSDNNTEENKSTELLLHLNYGGLQFSTYVDQEDASSYYSKYSSRLFGFWNNEIFYDVNRSEKHLQVGASKELMWRTSFDITEAVKAGYKVRYSLDTDKVSSTAYSLGYKFLNTEYIRYDDNNPYRLSNHGYNVELKLLGDSKTGVIISHRQNISDHSGMFVYDYPITTLTWMIRKP